MAVNNTHIELAWLEDFLALCESGNFTRAAERRYLTQPAFSRRIRLLEDWMDVELFNRSTHPVQLTEAGAQFQPVAREVLNRMVIARASAQAAKLAATHSLRFCATHVLSLTFFPAWLRSLESRLQVGPIQLVSDTLQACEDLMLQHRAELLICHYHADLRGRLDTADFESICIGVDTLVPVGGCSMRNGHVPLGDDTTPTLLDYGPESGLGRIVRAFRKSTDASSETKVSFTSHLATVLKAMALDGRGVAWLPRSLIQDELDAGKLIDLSPAMVHIPVEVHLFRRRDATSGMVDALWKAAGLSPVAACEPKCETHHVHALD